MLKKNEKKIMIKISYSTNVKRKKKHKILMKSGEKVIEQIITIPYMRRIEYTII